MSNGYVAARDRAVFWWGVTLGMIVGVPLFALIVMWVQ
jgi:hypothetical protein